jgi:hypothetical protein
MDELAKLVAKKTGISQDQAKQAVTIVVDFLKKKLPAPLAGQIDTVLAGGGVSPDLVKGLGGLIGKKK